MEWSNEKVLSLLEMYRSHPVLWNCKLKGYKDRNKRHSAFVEIALRFGIEKREIERKLKNLLCHFSREIKKEKDSVRSSIGTEEVVYKSKWFAYRSMAFLKDRNRSIKTTGTQDTSDVMMAIAPDEIALDVVDNRNETSVLPTSTSRGKKQSLNYSRPKNKSKRTATDEALAIVNEILGAKSARDEHALFGDQVGVRIRSLPSPYTRKIARQLISTVLFDAEMGKYDCPPVTSSRPYPGAHACSQPLDSGVLMYAYIDTSISSKTTFRRPFSSPGQVSSPTVSSASFTDDPETSDSDSIDNLLREI